MIYRRVAWRRDPVARACLLAGIGATAIGICLFVAGPFRCVYWVGVQGQSGSSWFGPFRAGETFAIRYIHSVDRTPVTEVYAVGRRGLVLVESRFVHWGAGLGYMGEGRLAEVDGVTVISGLNRKVGELLLRVGSVGDHRIVWRHGEIRLLDLFPAFSLVKVSVRRGSRASAGATPGGGRRISADSS